MVLNIKVKYINMGETYGDLGLGKEFLDLTPKTLSLRRKIAKLNPHVNFKNLYFEKHC